MKTLESMIQKRRKTEKRLMEMKEAKKERLLVKKKTLKILRMERQKSLMEKMNSLWMKNL